MKQRHIAIQSFIEVVYKKNQSI